MSTTATPATSPPLGFLANAAFYNRDDVHDVLSGLRDRGPAWRVAGDPGFVAVLAYSNAQAILNDEQSFSSSAGVHLGDLGATGKSAAGRMAALCDGGDHERLRAGLQQWLGRTKSKRFVRDLRQQVDRFLAAQMHGEIFDVVETVARPVASHVIADILGVPGDMQPKFFSWCDDAFDDGLSPTSPARRLANTDLLTYLRRVGAQGPARDAGTARPDAGCPGALGDPGTFALNAHLLIAGGYDTTRHAVAGVVHLAGREPAVLAPGVAVPIAQRVNECLRLASPALSVVRAATQRVQVGAVRVAAGEHVAILIPAVNRDPSVFAHPDRYQPGPDRPPSLTFGSGVHECIGAWLARYVLRVLIEQLLDLNVAVVPAASGPNPLLSLRSRGFAELPVRFVPRQPQGRSSR